MINRSACRYLTLDSHTQSLTESISRIMPLMTAADFCDRNAREFGSKEALVDRRQRLKSIPVRFGVPKSLLISRTMHLGAIVCLALLGMQTGLGSIYFFGVAAVAGLLVYEQSLVSATDLSRVKLSFDLNGYVGILYFVVTAMSVYAGR